MITKAAKALTWMSFSLNDTVLKRLPWRILDVQK